MSRHATIVRRIVPGVYGDLLGGLHLDVPELLRARRIRDRHRMRWAGRALTELRRDFPHQMLFAHRNGVRPSSVH